MPGVPNICNIQHFQMSFLVILRNYRTQNYAGICGLYLSIVELEVSLLAAFFIFKGLACSIHRIFPGIFIYGFVKISIGEIIHRQGLGIVVIGLMSGTFYAFPGNQRTFTCEETPDLLQPPQDRKHPFLSGFSRCFTFHCGCQSLE